MSLRDDLAVLTPRLRRYAQGLCNSAQGSNESADALVQQTLRHALETGSLNPRSNVTIWVYSLLTQFHREAASRLHGANAAGEGHRIFSQVQTQPAVLNGSPSGFGGVLTKLSLEEREALLLVALEGFTYAQASSILRISRAMFIARLTQARAALIKAMNPVPLPSALRRQAPHLRVVK